LFVIGSGVVFCFFFQAEDGIRDLIVTGVQTCALPISLRRGIPGSVSSRHAKGRRPPTCREFLGTPAAQPATGACRRERERSGKARLESEPLPARRRRYPLPRGR